ncbi:MAG: hypothetical protein JXA39_05840, partial [Bacteroidales bacterium]|nr:hypothetical protein [Bacteroidales bacterium]
MKKLTSLKFLWVLLLIGIFSLSAIYAQPVLKHSYTFEGTTAEDVVGDVDGVLQGTMITIADGACTVSGTGGSTDGYIQLDGAALALNTYSAITLEAFIKAGNAENVNRYTMLAYFGTNTAGSKCFWMQPSRGNSDVSQVEANNGSNYVALNSIELDDNKKHHLVAILTTETISYYLNGSLIAQKALGADNFISNLGTDFACLFKGVWNDPNYNGSIYEFNIYDGVLDAATITAHAETFMGTRNANLASLTPGVGELTPAFNPYITEYAVGIPAGTTTVTVAAEPIVAGAAVTGTGDVTITGGVGTASIQVVSVDLSDTMTYAVLFMEVDPDCYQPFYSDRDNLVPDPECTDLSKWGGWGNRSIYVGPEAYCGVSCAKLDAPDAGCRAALDISGFTWRPNATYHLNVMVKTIGGSIGFLASATDPNFGFAVDTEGEWQEVDVTFTTGPNAGTNFYSFNTCDFGSNCTEAYIDNYQLYDITPMKVGYITFNKTTMVATAAPLDNDPIIQLMRADPNFDLDVKVVASDSVFDLNGYEMIVVQEGFGSGDAILKPTGSLALEKIKVPFIYNKAYALRNGKAITSATAGAGEMEGELLMVVPEASKSHSLFNGITFDGDSVQLFKTGADDNGGDSRTKAYSYATSLEMTDATTLLAKPKGAPAEVSVCINDIPAGTVLGTEDTLQARMIAISENFGAICKDMGNNLTEDGLTLWRNAFYLAAGLDVPTEPVSTAIEIELSASAGMVATNANAGSFEITLPSGSTSVDLTVDLISGRDPQVPAISGLSDGQDAVYDLLVHSVVGTDSMVYKVYVHVQAENEIAYLSADSYGVLADARMYDQNPVHMLKDAGLSVTFLHKSSLNAVPFDYSPYAVMLMAPGNSSSNIVQFARDGYPIPAVCMQP